MGGENSKPVKPPTDWAKGADDSGDGGLGSFQIISPTSDISNPSDIYRVAKNRNHRTYVRKGASTAEDRRTAASARRATQPAVPEPASFYFPSKHESSRPERKVMAMPYPKKEIQREVNVQLPDGKKEQAKAGRGRLIQLFGGCFQEANQDQQLAIVNHPPIQVKAGPVGVTSKHKISTAQSKKAILNSKNYTAKNSKLASSTTHQRKVTVLADVDRNVLKANRAMSKHEVKPLPMIREKKGENKDLTSENQGNVARSHKSQNIHGRANLTPKPVVSGAALHQADAYFSNLAYNSAFSAVKNESQTKMSPMLALHGKMLQPSPLLGVSNEKDESKNDMPTPKKYPYPLLAGTTSTIQDVMKNDDRDDGIWQDDGSHTDEEGDVAVPNEGEPTKQRLQDMSIDLDEILPVKSNQDPLPLEEKVEGKKDDVASASLKLSALTLGSYTIQQVYSTDDLVVPKSKTFDDDEDETIADSDIESEAGTYFKPEEKKDTKMNQAVTLPSKPIQQVATLSKRTVKTGSEAKRSKLETLFRPALPSSQSESKTVASDERYDPYEIKVTESAPGAIHGSSDYRAVALARTNTPDAVRNQNQFATSVFSPSVMSVDSQVPTPSNNVESKNMMSVQALSNASFLFNEKYANGNPALLHRNLQPHERNSELFSISTLAARSRVSHKTAPGKIPASLYSLSKEGDKATEGGYAARYVQSLKGNTVEIPNIENKMSDLTDTLGDSGSLKATEKVPEIQKCESIAEVQSQCSPDRTSKVTFTENRVSVSPESLVPRKQSLDEPSLASQSSDCSMHWAYRIGDDGRSAATPFVGKHKKNESLKPVSEATNSPFLRFKAAKNKFGDIAEKEIPVKGKSKTPTKPRIQRVSSESTMASSTVSARVKELNKRVRDMKKLKRNRRSGGLQRNGACSQNELPLIRTQVIISYKPEKIGAGRFNLACNETTDDASSVASSVTDNQIFPVNAHNPGSLLGSMSEEHSSIAAHQMSLFHNEPNQIEEDPSDSETESDSIVTAPTVSTVRQVSREVLDARFRTSISSASTVSSRISALRTNMFGRNNKKSLDSTGLSAVSSGESTTLSALMNKENGASLPFRNIDTGVKPVEQNHHAHFKTNPGSLFLSPTQRTPSQARKWRELAAAAQGNGNGRRGLFTAGSKSKPRKVLSARNLNGGHGATFVQ